MVEKYRSLSLVIPTHNFETKFITKTILVE